MALKAVLALKVNDGQLNIQNAFSLLMGLDTTFTIK